MNEQAGSPMTDYSFLDRPEVVQLLFYPRRDFHREPMVANATAHMVPVDDGVSISCRLYPVNGRAPSILYFHGNGEIAGDYDQIAPLFMQIGVSLFVADYRGYGSSDGTPTFSAMMKDAHPLFKGFKDLVGGDDGRGSLFIMGRSLGSAPAVELAFHYQDQVAGLIIESGFASIGRLVDLLNVPAERLEADRSKLSFNVDRIGSIAIPTLIIHGEYDTLIPVQHGRDLYHHSGAKEKELVVIPGATHNDIFLIGMEQYLEAIRRFVVTYG